ncbi:MAG: serine hydrolase domain-containing protein [Candidatus Nanopelagicales bacterium]
MQTRRFRIGFSFAVALTMVAALLPATSASAAPAISPRGEITGNANRCVTGKSAKLKRTMNEIRKNDQADKPLPPNIARPVPALPGALGAITTPSGIQAYGSGDFRAHELGNIGSVTKSFTAAIVLQLVQERKIKLSEKIYKWRKQINWRGNKNILKKISVKRVLDHTSGIPELMDAPQVKPNANNPKFNPTPRQLVGWASMMPMAFAPGTSWAYSNTDYEILGLIIESVTKRSYDNQLRTRLFKPLGLKSTSLVRGKAKPTVQGYYFTPKQPVTNPIKLQWTKLAANANSQMRWAWAAGGIQSTSCDITKWISALLDSNKVLNAKYRKKMQTVTPKSVAIAPTVLPGWTGYGLGLMRISLDGSTGWGHLGNIPGFASGALYVKSKNVSTGIILPSGAAGAVDAMTRLVAARS